MTKVLLVVTNNDKLGSTGKKTGWYLPEVAHPYEVFTKAGYEVTFVSPKGGKAPMDEGSLDASKGDPVSVNFHKNKLALLANTKSPKDVIKNARDYKIIFYAGGYGPMWDVPDCEPLAELGVKIYENGGIIGAVCHGTVGLVNMKLSSGGYLLKGKTVTSFTNSEEDAVQLKSVVPFLLEDRLKERGATFVGKADWAPNVQTSDCKRIVSGQNPLSANPTADAIVKLVK